MIRSFAFRCLAVVAVVGSMFIAGCGGGGSVTQGNYDKVNTGMTEAEVQAILGKPAESQSSGAALPGMTMNAKSAVWKSGNKAITVMFVNGKVAAKQSSGL